MNGGAWFRAKIAYYAQYGARLEESVRSAGVLSEADLATLFSCDAIHLSGGDTVEFLGLIRKHHLEQRFRDYVSSGGVLIGVSAGSILITPTVGTTFEGENGDERRQESFDLTGLGLVDFGFRPHYVDVLEPRLRALAPDLDLRIYACRDGDGQIVDGDEVRLIFRILIVEP